jgi:quercetin dioxygenase-like cupin family protein
MRRTTQLAAVTAAMIAGGGIALAADRALVGQQAGIRRTILLTTDNPASPAAHEVIMGISELASGASSGKHRHHGVEIGYVLEGSVLVEHDGKPSVTLTAGQSFKIDGVHNAFNRSAQPTRVLAIYIVEKGKPLADPVR